MGTVILTPAWTDELSRAYTVEEVRALLLPAGADPAVLSAWCEYRRFQFPEIRGSWLASDLKDLLAAIATAEVPPMSVADAVGWALVAGHLLGGGDEPYAWIYRWWRELGDHSGWRYVRAGIGVLEFEHLVDAGLPLPDAAALAALGALNQGTLPAEHATDPWYGWDPDRPALKPVPWP